MENKETLERFISTRENIKKSPKITSKIENINSELALNILTPKNINMNILNKEDNCFKNYSEKVLDLNKINIKNNNTNSQKSSFNFINIDKRYKNSINKKDSMVSKADKIDIKFKDRIISPKNAFNYKKSYNSNKTYNDELFNKNENLKFSPKRFEEETLKTANSNIKDFFTKCIGIPENEFSKINPIQNREKSPDLLNFEKLNSSNLKSSEFEEEKYSFLNFNSSSTSFNKSSNNYNKNKNIVISQISKISSKGAEKKEIELKNIMDIKNENINSFMNFNENFKNPNDKRVNNLKYTVSKSRIDEKSLGDGKIKNDGKQNINNENLLILKENKIKMNSIERNRNSVNYIINTHNKLGEGKLLSSQKIKEIKIDKRVNDAQMMNENKDNKNLSYFIGLNKKNFIPKIKFASKNSLLKLNLNNFYEYDKNTHNKEFKLGPVNLLNGKANENLKNKNSYKNKPNFKDLDSLLNDNNNKISLNNFNNNKNANSNFKTTNTKLEPEILDQEIFDMHLQHQKEELSNIMVKIPDLNNNLLNFNNNFLLKTNKNDNSKNDLRSDETYSDRTSSLLKSNRKKSISIKKNLLNENAINNTNFNENLGTYNNSETNFLDKNANKFLKKENIEHFNNEILRDDKFFDLKTKNNLILKKNLGKNSDILISRNPKKEDANKLYNYSYYFNKYYYKPEYNQRNMLIPHVNFSEEDDRSIKNFNNVYDSFSEEEIDESLIKKPIYILSPNSQIKVLIDIICCFLIIYSIILSPYQMAFDDDNYIQYNFFFYFDSFIDCFFILDLILNFFTAYSDSKEDTVYNIKKIAINYMKSWFFLDLISCIPFTIINTIIQNSGGSVISDDLQYLNDITYVDINSIDPNGNQKISNVVRLQKFAKIARLYRVLKWTRIFRILKMTKQTNQANPFKKLDDFSDSINRFLKFLIFFIILTHITACLWCFLAKFQIALGETQNWIHHYKLQDEKDYLIYISAIYFILTTIFSIGYGDITAVNLYERAYIVLIMMIGCFVYSFAITSLSNIFSKFDKKTEIFNKKEALLNDIKLEYKINSKLYDKIKKALKYELLHWNDDRLTLLDSLPTILRNQLYLKMYEKKITHLVFFTDKTHDFITLAVSLIKSAKFSKNDYIISLGELIDEMYITISGTIALQLGPQYQRYQICEIPKGYHFGDILMYTNQQSQLNYRVKSNFSHHFVIPKVNFAQLKLNFHNPICKNLEYSYSFFTRIEKIRVLAIKYFKKHGGFTGFRFFLKKIINQYDEESEEENLNIVKHSKSQKKINNNSYQTIYSKKSPTKRNTEEENQNRLLTIYNKPNINKKESNNKLLLNSLTAKIGQKKHNSIENSINTYNKISKAKTYFQTKNGNLNDRYLEDDSNAKIVNKRNSHLNKSYSMELADSFSNNSSSDDSCESSLSDVFTIASKNEENTEKKQIISLEKEEKSNLNQKNNNKPKINIEKLTNEDIYNNCSTKTTSKDLYKNVPKLSNINFKKNYNFKDNIKSSELNENKLLDRISSYDERSPNNKSNLELSNNQIIKAKENPEVSLNCFSNYSSSSKSETKTKDNILLKNNTQKSNKTQITNKFLSKKKENQFSIQKKNLFPKYLNFYLNKVFKEDYVNYISYYNKNDKKIELETFELIETNYTENSAKKEKINILLKNKTSKKKVIKNNRKVKIFDRKKVNSDNEKKIHNLIDNPVKNPKHVNIQDGKNLIKSENYVIKIEKHITNELLSNKLNENLEDKMNTSFEQNSRTHRLGKKKSHDNSTSIDKLSKISKGSNKVENKDVKITSEFKKYEKSYKNKIIINRNNPYKLYQNYNELFDEKMRKFSNFENSITKDNYILSPVKRISIFKKNYSNEPKYDEYYADKKAKKKSKSSDILFDKLIFNKNNKNIIKNETKIIDVNHPITRKKTFAKRIDLTKELKNTSVRIIKNNFHKKSKSNPKTNFESSKEIKISINKNYENAPETQKLKDLNNNRSFIDNDNNSEKRVSPVRKGNFRLLDSSIKNINLNKIIPFSSKSKVFNKKSTFLIPPTEESNNIKIESSKDFIKNLSDKISYDAFLYKNKEVLQMCIKDFLDEIKGKSSYKNMINRLNKIETFLKEVVNLKNKSKKNLNEKENSIIIKRLRSFKFNLKSNK